MTKSFVEENEERLRRWCESLQAYEGPIVAISRKGPRLLELAHRKRLLADADLQRVTSERALAFRLFDRGSSEVITICDDICIFGSTFQRIFAVASRIYGQNAVRSIPFAVSRSSESIPREAGRGLTIKADNCTAFVHSELAAFSSLHKPYDIEHPILYLQLDIPAERHWVHYGLTEITRKLGATLYTTDIDGWSREPSWTFLPSHASQVEPNCIRKIRMYYDQSTGRLAFVPIAPIVGSLGEIEGQVEELPESLSRSWKDLKSNVATIVQDNGEHDKTDRLFFVLRDRSLVSWANYLIELHDLLADLHALRSGLSRLGFLHENISFLMKEYDVALLVTRDRARGLTSEICHFVNDSFPREMRCSDRKTACTLTPQLPDMNAIYGQNLPGSFVDYETAKHQLLQGSATASDVLESIFKAQHVAIELPSRQNDAAYETRLEFGVSWPYLFEHISQHLEAVPDERTANQALDTLIDSGVIVPRYLCQPINGSDVWYRSFRVGEGQARATGHVVKECFGALGNVLGETVIGEVITEKFFVLNCDLREMFSDSSLGMTCKVSRGFHLYGARPQLPDSTGGEWMTEWACRMRILERIEHRNKHAYRLHAQAERYYGANSNESPLSPDRRREVASIARWLKEALASNQLGSSFLVAITTIESEWAFAKALKAEILGWISHEQFGLPAVVFAYDDFVADSSEDNAQVIRRKLEGLANWVAQAQIKRNLRDRFDDLLTEANSMWPSEYTDTGSTWQHIVRPSLESRSAELARPFGVVDGSLIPILGVMRRLSTLLRSVDSEYVRPHAQLGLFGDDRSDSETRVRPVNESLAMLIDEIESLPHELGIAFNGSLQEFRSLEKGSTVASVVDQLRNPVLGIGDAIGGILDRYVDLSDVPLEYLSSGHYVLSWDIRDSTKQDRDPLTRQILEVNKEIYRTFGDGVSTRLLEFDSDSTDDGAAAVCDDAKTALTIARIVVSRYHPHSVKMACFMCREGMLSKAAGNGKLSGRGFEYCARVMNFFSEIDRDPKCWKSNGENGMAAPVEAPETGSFFLIMGETYEHLCQSVADDDLEGFVKLPGLYSPRLQGAMDEAVYLKEWSV